MIDLSRPVWECSCGMSFTHIEKVASTKLCGLCGGELKPKENRVVAQTSLLAYGKFDEDKLSGRRKLILEEFKRGPGTDCEVMKRLGFSDPNKVRPRRKELVDLGLLFDRCKRVCQVTGETVTEWEYRG